MNYGFSDRVIELSTKAEGSIREQLKNADIIAFENTQKVLNAFRKNKVSESCFSGSTGYGYDDMGREVLDKVYADIFHTQSALVRINFVSGTHALACALFALAKPGETILSVSGMPYDTLQTAIGINSSEFSSLSFYGINYKQIDLLPSGTPNFSAIENELRNDETISAVILQRSRGYTDRKALCIGEISAICSCVKSVRKDIVIMVDNCYGEFTETLEPTDAGADLIAGSLIKNPGGGIAPAGGYVAGKEELVTRAAFRLTSPGIGGECGPTLGNNRLLFQGLFLAPHIVSQAMKTAVYCSALMTEAGYKTFPRPHDKRSDIIQVVQLNSGEELLKFCRGIQAGAPIDSHFTPKPWKMPGYDCEVIMAAGTFIQGSSIELSADGPYMEPYFVYVQGGLTYESGKIGIMTALQSLLGDG